MRYPESDGCQVWAAPTQARVHALLAWLGAVLRLEHSSVLLCSLLNTGGRLLLARRDAELYTGHNYFDVKDAELPRHFLLATGQVRHTFLLFGARIFTYSTLVRKENC